jgi:non-specific protein-tyrosine kinase
MKLADASILLRLAVRNALFILPFSILGILAGNFVSASTTPLFKSSADLFISTPASAVDIGLLATGSTFSQERVKSYTQIINAPATLQPVIDRLQLATTPEALASRITAQAPPDTVVIRIQVVDENPERAAAIANEVSMQFALTAESIELPQANSSSPVKVSVARPAVPEYGPISPKKNTNRLLGLVAFTLAAYLFFLIRYLSDLTVKNVNDISDLPLLAAIGFDPNADKNPLLTDIGAYEARTEAFRSLRTNLLNAIGTGKTSVIAITSGVAEEGKTTTSINLAISLANQGLNTLLIEGDLRRPRLTRYINHSNQEPASIGLSHVLQSKSASTLRETTAKATVHYLEKLDFISSGEITQNPTELLASPNLQSLFDLVRSKYDIILIDCPPVLPVTDASVIAKVVDGVVIIVYGGRTRIKAFESTIDALKLIQTKILGVVINKIPNSRDSEDYGYKSGYSRYYKRTYGYGFKRRGYTPYGPYNPKEIENIENSTEKSSKWRDAPKDSVEKDSSINLNALEASKSKKRALINETAAGKDEADLAVEEWLNKLRANTESRVSPAKKVSKKATPAKKVSKKATPAKKVSKKATAKKSTKRI